MHAPKKYVVSFIIAIKRGGTCTHSASIPRLHFMLKVSNISSRRRCNPSTFGATTKPLKAVLLVLGSGPMSLNAGSIKPMCIVS